MRLTHVCVRLYPPEAGAYRRVLLNVGVMQCLADQELLLPSVL